MTVSEVLNMDMKKYVMSHTWAWDDHDEHDCRCESMITLSRMIMRMLYAMNDNASMLRRQGWCATQCQLRCTTLTTTELATDLFKFSICFSAAAENSHN